MVRILRYGLLWLILGPFAAVWAAGGGAALSHADLDTDPGELRRGARTALHLCMLCHSLKYVRYRDLLDIGFDRAQIDAFRGGLDLDARLESTTAPAQARTLYGLVPPDLSLITIAREEGPHYVYSLMTAYYRTDAGDIENRIFPGTVMPDVFGYSVAPSPEQRSRIEGRARAVTAFLAWAADPRASERRKIGYGVMAYLIVLTLLLYLVKRRVWARLD